MPPGQDDKYDESPATSPDLGSPTQSGEKSPPLPAAEGDVRQEDRDYQAERARNVERIRAYQDEARKKYDYAAFGRHLVENLNRNVLREAEEDAERSGDAKDDTRKPVNWTFVTVDHDLVAIARWESGQNAWKLVDGTWQELHGDALGVAIFEGHVCERPDDLPPLPEIPSAR